MDKKGALENGNYAVGLLKKISLRSNQSTPQPAIIYVFLQISIFMVGEKWKSWQNKLDCWVEDEVGEMPNLKAIEH